MDDHRWMIIALCCAGALIIYLWREWPKIKQYETLHGQRLIPGTGHTFADATKRRYIYWFLAWHRQTRAYSDYVATEIVEFMLAQRDPLFWVSASELRLIDFLFNLRTQK
jgi:hypothetical protein